MKDINSVAEHYPAYVHEYYTGLCEIDFCKNTVTHLFLLPNGEGSPMCDYHAHNYKVRAKLAAESNALVDKNWSIVITSAINDAQTLDELKAENERLKNSIQRIETDLTNGDFCRYVEHAQDHCGCEDIHKYFKEISAQEAKGR